MVLVKVVKQRKRVGRGHSSGRGGTSCRGHKGQRSRAGAKRDGSIPTGQTPLYRRIPKRGGGFLVTNSKSVKLINLSTIVDLVRDCGLKVVDLSVLKQYNLCGVSTARVKILKDVEDIKFPSFSLYGISYSKSVQQIMEGNGCKL